MKPAPSTVSSEQAHWALTQLTALLDERDALVNANAALQAQAVVMYAQFAALRMQLASGQVCFIIGASNADTALGTLPIRRRWESDEIGGAPTEPVCYSYRPANGKPLRQAGLTNWVRSAPRGSTLTMWPEPEKAIEAGQLTANQWMIFQVALCKTIVDCHRVGEVRPMAVLMARTLQASSGRARLLKQLADPHLAQLLRQTEGIWGWDVDSSATAGEEPGTYVSPVALFAPLAAYAMSIGLPWAISDVHIRHHGDVDEELCASWWQSVFDYLSTSPPAYFLIRNSPNSPHAIQSMPAVADVWRKAIATYSAGVQ